MINQKQLKEISEELEEAILKVEDDRYSSLYESLKPIFELSKKYEIIEPLENVPGSYFMFEGDGRTYDEEIDYEVKNKYANFHFRVTREDHNYERALKFLKNQKDK